MEKKKIDLENVIEFLQDLPKSYWQEQQESNKYQFCTQVDSTKIEPRGERDVPGFYRITLEYEISPAEVSGGDFKLKVFKGKELILSSSGRKIQQLYDHINIKLHRNQFQQLRNRPQ